MKPAKESISTPEGINSLENKNLSEEERIAKRERLNQLLKEAGLSGIVTLK